MATSPLSGVSLNLVESVADAVALMSWLSERRPDDRIAIDTESGGLSPERDALRLIQVGDGSCGWVIPWERWGGVALEVFQKYRGSWVTHNGVFDWRFIERHTGFELPWDRLDDTLTMARLDEPTRANGLKPLSKTLIDRRAVAGQKALEDGFAANGWNWSTVPVDFPPYWCVPKTTEILTRRGWLPWDQVMVGDETLGYQDGKNVWTRITAIHTPGVAETVRLGSKHWSTICTPDHRWVMQKGAARAIKVLSLNEGWRDASNTKLVLSAEAEGGASPLTPDEAAVLAWILSDGHVQWQRPKTWTSPIAHIVQKPGLYADKIRDLLKREGAYVSERLVGEPNECLRFYVSAPYVTALWKKARIRGAPLTDLVVRLTTEARAAWVEAWLDAEGTKGTQVVSQKEGPKADALALSLYMEGYAVDIQGTYRGVHRFHYTRKRPTPQKTRVTPNGPVDVWCPTTELGTWTARDVTGNIFLTGNCYSALDVVLTSRLYDHFSPIIESTCPEAYSLERAANRLCALMMRKGMLLDVPYVENSISQFDKSSEDIRAWLKTRHEITSPKSSGQLKRAFEALGQDILFFTDRNAPQFDKDALAFYEKEGQNEAVKQLAAYIRTVRHIEDIRDRYARKFLELRDADDVVHCNINVMGARTGRMSVSDPALQQLPRDDKVIRGSFIPRPGHVLISCDLDQVEMRILAHLSQDPGLIQAFLEADGGGADFFTSVARVLYHDGTLVKSDGRRQLVKNSSYARAYGGGREKLAMTAGVSTEEIRVFEELFDTRFPGMRKLMNRLEGDAKSAFRAGKRGGVHLDDGRFLPCDQGKEYAVLNYAIQGEAARFMKQCLVSMDSAGLTDMMLLPVHDEILLEAPADQAEEVIRVVQSCMSDDIHYRVPLTAGGQILEDRWQK